MLIWMREGAGAGVLKYVLLGLLLMAVCGLVLMDIGGFFKNPMSSSTVVKGAGISISIQDFDRTVRRALSQQQGMAAQEAYKLGNIDKILQGEVQNSLFTAEARDAGLRVGDDDVRDQVAKLARPLAKDGRSLKDALKQVLQTQGISESEFIYAIRDEMANGLLRNVLQAPATLTAPSLVGNLYRYDNEKRSAKVIILTNDSITDATKPTEENLQKYYDANKTDYMIPETRTITLATLTPAMIEKSAAISDADLHAEYDKNITSFTQAAVRTIEQSVFATQEEAAKAVESLKGGKSLKDSSGADAYLGEKDYDESNLQPELTKPVFAATENTPVGPLQSSMGWHILIVKKIVPEFVLPFDAVKAKLKTEMEQSSVSDAMYQAGNTIEDRIAGGDKLEDLVKDYGMTTEIIGPFHRNGIGTDGKDLFKPYVADREKLIQAAYDYEDGEMSNLVETADGQFHVIHIDHVTPDTFRDFKSVHADVEKRWLDDQKQLLGKSKAKTILDAVNGGKTLEDVARENNLPVRTFDIARTTEIPAPLTTLVAAQIFTTDKGKNFSSETNTGYVIGQVTNITLPPAPQSDSKEMKDLEDLVGRSLKQDLLGQYIAHMSKGKKIQVNRQLLDQTYAPAAPAKE